MKLPLSGVQLTELAELALALLLVYDHSRAGNHNAVQLMNGAEHWQDNSNVNKN